ncbi:MAG: hypothetical protein MI861_22965 [Pirellulales bacterium]|nr:hypothetical protein [Pirellulales bacterium]
MQFRIAHLLLLVLWAANAIAGYSMDGLTAAVLLCLLLGAAMIFGTLTLQTWPDLGPHEKRTSLFATTVSLLGFIFLFLVLAARSAQDS